MKKIVLAGASVYGLNNLSDDSMLVVFCRDLHNCIPNLEITLLARHPSKELDDFYKVRSIKNLDHTSRSASKGRFYNGLNQGDPPNDLREIYKALKECDLLIIGGEPFIDISIGVYKGLTPYAALLITIAKFMGKPVMIKGIHLGRSLTTEMGHEMTKYCIANSNLVTIREENTRPLLKGMGIPTHNVITLSDTSYGLTPYKNLEAGNSILKDSNITINSNRILIGVTFRHMYWKWSNEVWNEYSSKVASVCDYMIENFSADVLFVPHNTYEIDDKYMNDIPAHHDIIQKIKNSNNVHQITKRYNIFETLSLFPLFDFVFSNRRHSLIFGALHGVSGLGVGEELHVKVTMEELGIDPERFVDIENFDLDLLITNIEAIFRKKEKISANFKNSLPSLIKRSLGHAELAAELIK